jgi:8-oxo-dGTP pyrophosphatase MutT (NUDIX family)
MNFEPQKFFIGLVDFFSIFMPGAVLAYLVRDWEALKFLGLADGFPFNGRREAAMFFFASYLLGHLAFLLSAALDEWVYDPLRAWTDWGQIKRLVKGDKLSALWQRRLAASDLLFGEGADNAVMQVQRIKARALQALEADDAMKAFQWCKVRLTKDLPEGLLLVQRFEADSKFFRSFFVVLGALALIYAHRENWLAEALCLLGMLPALWRYIDQRFKATQQAYWFVIMLEARRMLEAKEAKVPAPAPRQDGLSLAGGIVYQRTGVGEAKQVEFMLVQASKKPEEWVLPKGHIEPGEDPRITAVREIREETGHWARVECWLGNAPLDQKKPDSPQVRWFLLELCEGPAAWRCEDRKHDWLPPTAAINTAKFDESKAVLKKADDKLKSKDEAKKSKDQDKSRLTHRT